MVCQKSKIIDWINHFNEFYHDYYDVYDLTKPKQLKEFLDTNYISVGVINYDLIWRRPELLKLKKFTLLLDESSEIQNAKSKRGKFILKMNQNHTILLSGTPTSNGHYEYMWTQVHLLGWNITEATFKNHYCVIDYVKNWKGNYILGPSGYPIKKIVGYKNEEHLKAKLRLYGASFLKTEEVIDLPEKNDIKLNIPVSSEYKKFMKDKIITIDDETLVGDMKTKEYLYSRYLCGAYNQSKLDKLRDLINSTEDRLIIFYNFNNELEKIKSVCGDRPISEINGKVKNLTSYEGYDNSITLIQYQAGAMGLNLQKANKIIYFSLTNRCGLWMQSRKRIHRLNQTRPCFYYILLCGIEHRMFDCLQRGVDYTDELFKYDMETL